MGLLHIKTGLSRNMLRELSKVRGIDVGEGKLNAAFRSLKRRYRLRGKIRVKRLESVAFHNKKRDRLLISRRGVRSLFWRVFKGRLKRRKILKNNYNLLRRLLKIIPMLLFRS